MAFVLLLLLSLFSTVKSVVLPRETATTTVDFIPMRKQPDSELNTAAPSPTVAIESWIGFYSTESTYYPHSCLAGETFRTSGTFGCCVGTTYAANPFPCQTTCIDASRIAGVFGTVTCSNYWASLPVCQMGVRKNFPGGQKLQNYFQCSDTTSTEEHFVEMRATTTSGSAADPTTTNNEDPGTALQKKGNQIALGLGLGLGLPTLLVTVIACMIRSS